MNPIQPTANGGQPQDQATNDTTDGPPPTSSASAAPTTAPVWIPYVKGLSRRTMQTETYSHYPHTMLMPSNNLGHGSQVQLGQMHGSAGSYFYPPWRQTSASSWDPPAMPLASADTPMPTSQQQHPPPAMYQPPVVQGRLPEFFNESDKDLPASLGRLQVTLRRRRREDPAKQIYDASKESPDKDKACIICIEKAQDTAFVPCGHSHFCWKCANHIFRSKQQCPTCRSWTKMVMKIYR